VIDPVKALRIKAEKAVKERREAKDEGKDDQTGRNFDMLKRYQ